MDAKSMKDYRAEFEGSEYLDFKTPVQRDIFTEYGTTMVAIEESKVLALRETYFKIQSSLTLFLDKTKGVKPDVLFLGKSHAESIGIKEGHLASLGGLEVQRMEDPIFVGFGFRVTSSDLYDFLKERQEATND